MVWPLPVNLHGLALQPRFMETKYKLSRRDYSLNNCAGGFIKAPHDRKKAALPSQFENDSRQQEYRRSTCEGSSYP